MKKALKLTRDPRYIMRHPTQYFEPAKIIILLIIISACGGQSLSEKRAEEEAKQVREDIKKLVSDLPHPTVIPNAIKAIGAEFDPSVVSPLHGMETYQANEDKAAMNLGVFSADIGYLIAYDEVDESMDHMKTCDQLADALRVPTSFNESTIQQYQASMNDHQALLDLWDNTALSWEQQFDSAQRQSMAALVLTGNFVEELFLIIKVLETYHTDDMDKATRDEILEPLVKLLLDQEKALADVIRLLRHLPLDNAIGTMIAELSILENLFQGDLADIRAGIANDENFVISPNMLLDINLR